MSLHRYIFWGLLLVTCGFALWRGRNDERTAALVCVVATLATRLTIAPIALRYSSVELGLLFIDLAVLACFVAIALRSERFWPLWIAGLQLTISVSHVLKALDESLLPRAYAAAAVLWSYPILVIIAVGTWRGCQRRKQSDNFPLAA